jgi:hypothetical protein
MVYAFVTKNILEIQTGFDSAMQILRFNFGVLFEDFLSFMAIKLNMIKS